MSVFIGLAWAAYNDVRSALIRSMPSQRIRISLIRSLLKMQRENGVDLGFRIDKKYASLSPVVMYQTADGKDILIDVSYPVYLYLCWLLRRQYRYSERDYVLSDVQSKLERYIDQNNAAMESAICTQRDVVRRLQEEPTHFHKDYIQSKIDVLL